MSFFSKDNLSFKLNLILKNFEKSLKEKNHIHILYGGVDGLNLACSGIKFLKELNQNALKKKNSSQYDSPDHRKTHFLAIASIFICSLTAHYPGSQNNPFLKSFASTWPYLRDAFKGFKNTYKGIQAIEALTARLGKNTRIDSLFLPMGCLGVLTRVLIRNNLSERKKILSISKGFLEQLWKSKNSKQLTLENGKKYLEDKLEIEKKIKSLEWVYPIVFVNSVLDSFYLYFRIITLCPVSPPTLLAMISCSILYSLLTVIVRMEEEYRRQKEIRLIQEEIRDLLDIEPSQNTSEKTIQIKACLQGGSNSISGQLLSPNPFRQNEILSRELEKSLLPVNGNRPKSFFKENLPKCSPKVFAGLGNGLAAYGALLSMLTTAKQFFTFNIGLKPIASGMGLISFFVWLALRKDITEPLLKQSDTDIGFLSPLSTTNHRNLDNPKNSKYSKGVSKYKHGMFGASNHANLYGKECIEIVRSFFSGLGKGSNVFHFVKKLFEASEHPFLGFASAIIFGVTLALRGVVKEFKKLPALSEKILENIPSIDYGLNLS